ncbi:MAG: DnaD domain protein [Peptococcaceae bacterium]|nr:MAG: DnaD domain protein [Peptococcaceae bacterium]
MAPERSSKTIGSKTVKQYRVGNVTAAFGTDLFIHGATCVPNILLKYYKKMDITDNQMMLIIQMLRLRCEEKEIYPSIEQLAELVNADSDRIKVDLDEMVRKEVLSVTQYFDKGRNLILSGYDFEPLFEKISETWACAKVKEIEEAQEFLESSGENLPPAGRGGESNLRDLYQAFEKEFGRPLSPMEIEQIEQWAAEGDSVLIMEALRRAVLMGKHNFKYINSILLEWKKNKLNTLESIAGYDRHFQKRRAGRNTRGSDPTLRNKDKERDSKEKALIRKLYLS